jgi:hypothetical protein
MTQTLAAVKGRLKIPYGDLNVIGQAFVVQHNTPEELAEKLQAIMAECFQYGGLTIPIDEQQPKTITNIRFWPFDNFRYVWMEAKPLTTNLTGQEPPQ